MCTKEEEQGSYLCSDMDMGLRYILSDKKLQISMTSMILFLFKFMF